MSNLWATHAWSMFKAALHFILVCITFVDADKIMENCALWICAQHIIFQTRILTKARQCAISQFYTQDQPPKPFFVSRTFDTFWFLSMLLLCVVLNAFESCGCNSCPSIQAKWGSSKISLFFLAIAETTERPPPDTDCQARLSTNYILWADRLPGVSPPSQRRGHWLMKLCSWGKQEKIPESRGQKKLNIQSEQEWERRLWKREWASGWSAGWVRGLEMWAKTFSGFVSAVCRETGLWMFFINKQDCIKETPESVINSLTWTTLRPPFFG